MPKDLNGWKAFFREHIEEARCAAMSDEDRDELIEYLKEEAELIFFSPLPESPAYESAPADAWWDR